MSHLIFMSKMKGNLLAGLIAETYLEIDEIECLFVKERNREGRISVKLLQQAESEAKNRNCCFAFVNTYPSSRPDFYQKHGYKEVFSLQETISTLGKDIITKRICKVSMEV